MPGVRSLPHKQGFGYSPVCLSAFARPLRVFAGGVDLVPVDHACLSCDIDINLVLWLVVLNTPTRFPCLIIFSECFFDNIATDAIFVPQPFLVTFAEFQAF